MAFIGDENARCAPAFSNCGEATCSVTVANNP
jgi:hypothetical protein